MSEDEEIDPIVAVGNDGYYVGVWFLAGPKQDFMGTLYRDAMHVLQLDYRFRYYAPERDDGRRDPFDGRDEKVAYNVPMPDKTEDEAILIVDALVDKLVSEGYCGTRLPWKVQKLRHRVLVRGDGAAFKRAILGLPFVHVKVLDKGRIKKGTQ